MLYFTDFDSSVKEEQADFVEELVLKNPVEDDSSEENSENDNCMESTKHKISVISVDTINGRLNPLLLNMRMKMKEICKKSVQQPETNEDT